MKPGELKEYIISSLDTDADPAEVSARLREEGVRYEFSEGFRTAVIGRIFSAGAAVNRETEFVRNLTFVFRNIAYWGAAAIITLLISIFFMEGSLSLNSFLGLKDNYDESIVCLLTGK